MPASPLRETTPSLLVEILLDTTHCCCMHIMRSTERLFRATNDVHNPTDENVSACKKRGEKN